MNEILCNILRGSTHYQLPIHDRYSKIVLLLCLVPGSAFAQLSPVTQLPEVTVTGYVPTGLVQEDPSLGTSTYTLSHTQIDKIAQGENTGFNQVLVRTPGVSGDTYGAVHFRNEDPYYRYYLNGTLLPSGINGFSQDIDTHFVNSVTTKVGALPAYYPEGNYGIVDITSKSGSELNGGEVSLYGGTFDTINPELSYADSVNGTDFYFNGSYLHNSLGLENSTSNTKAIHDETNQYKGFMYLSHQFKDSGRLSFVFSGSDADFQIPNTPGQTPFFSQPFDCMLNPPNFVDSTALDERQNEQTYYSFISYQQTIDDFSFQVSQVNRSSTVLFNPDYNGDLLYNGVAARVNEFDVTNGVQGDFTWKIGDKHTMRGGVLADTQGAGASNSTYAYALDGDGNPTGAPLLFEDNHFIRAYDESAYIQDEWNITDKFTLNYGLRFEQVKGYTKESQFSPRITASYQVTKDTSLHAGYARYFDPPQLLNVSPNSVSQFDNTTNAADQDTDDPVKAEKSDYFDAGITHTIIPGLETGATAYYKIAKDQIDDGQFGAANISSPYNYDTATMYGVELSIDYSHDGFSAYGNLSVGDSWAKGIVSSQFEFDSAELAYINSNNVHLDQSQYYTGSAGASYTYQDTTVHADMTYGDGIRAGFANINKLATYYPVNIGVEHTFKKLAGAGDLTVRFDALNLFDQVYVLNDGTGIGEGAVKYGNRRGFYGGVSYGF